MKKLIIVVIGIMLFTSCETKESIKKDIVQLKTEKENILKDIDSLINVNNKLQTNVDSLKEKIKPMQIIASGKQPKYVLKLHLRQTHISLSISKHIKDAVNAIDFELPVDKEFYDKVKIGSEIVDEFRMGSLVLSGSFRSWDIFIYK